MNAVCCIHVLCSLITVNKGKQLITYWWFCCPGFTFLIASILPGVGILSHESQQPIKLNRHSTNGFPQQFFKSSCLPGWHVGVLQGQTNGSKRLSSATLDQTVCCGCLRRHNSSLQNLELISCPNSKECVNIYFCEDTGFTITTFCWLSSDVKAIMSWCNFAQLRWDK